MAGAFWLEQTCTVDFAPDSGWRGGDAGKTSDCGGFLPTGSGIKALIVQEWEDNCHFDLYDDLDMSCEKEVIDTFTKDDATEKDGSFCSNSGDFPDGFNFVYRCD